MKGFPENPFEKVPPLKKVPLEIPQGKVPPNPPHKRFLSKGTPLQRVFHFVYCYRFYFIGINNYWWSHLSLRFPFFLRKGMYANVPFLHALQGIYDVLPAVLCNHTVRIS